MTEGVTNDVSAIDQFALLADESANWKIAGLRQLERSLLALNEFATSLSAERDLSVIVSWRPDTPVGVKWIPHRRLTSRVRVTQAETSAPLPAGIPVLSTHFFLGRNSFAQILSALPLPRTTQSSGGIASEWSALSAEVEASSLVDLPALTGGNAKYLRDAAEINKCEEEFLRGAGKSQDGLVSRFINRPLSCKVTRQLLKFSIGPTAWTVGIFVLPLLAFFFLVRGDYLNVAIGAALFQLYSILDGCDGEIARAKYLESRRGGRIDDFLDMIGSVLFVTGLGLGLSLTHHHAYAWEGFLGAAVILANEIILRRTRRETESTATSLNGLLYARHREMVEHSGLLVLGEKNARWLIQFTKRDVAIAVFLLLALANLAPWILHLWITVSTVTLVLTVRAGARRRHAALQTQP
jgi:phosphatidylglycerophosphate synthase